jgi:Domain of unknown function (DUF6766)
VQRHTINECWWRALLRGRHSALLITPRRHNSQPPNPRCLIVEAGLSQRREHSPAEQVSTWQDLLSGTGNPSLDCTCARTVCSPRSFAKRLIGIKTARQARPREAEPANATPKHNSLWPVRRGGCPLTLYKHFSSIAFLALLFAALACTPSEWRRLFNEQQLEHGQRAISVWRYLTSPPYWNESMPNWAKRFRRRRRNHWTGNLLRQRGSTDRMR